MPEVASSMREAIRHADNASTSSDIMLLFYYGMKQADYLFFTRLMKHEKISLKQTLQTSQQLYSTINNYFQGVAIRSSSSPTGERFCIVSFLIFTSLNIFAYLICC